MENAKLIEISRFFCLPHAFQASIPSRLLLIHKAGDVGLGVFTEEVRGDPVAERAWRTDHVNPALTALRHKLLIRCLVNSPLRFIRVILDNQ